MSLERLQKVLAHAGVASRRKAESLIESGRVKVNGQIVKELGCKVNPAEDIIEVDSKRIHGAEKLYFLFHKPTGVITSVSDPQGRKVVLDFFRDIPERIYPVGRLDRDTSGLLLLTNDGELVHKLLHPSFKLEKTYLAKVQGQVQARDIARLKKGLELEDGWTAPAKAELLEKNPQENSSRVRLSIYEGRKRQVRRMFKTLGYPVLTLHRERFAFLTLVGVQLGTYRALSKAEVDKLYQSVT